MLMMLRDDSHALGHNLAAPVETKVQPPSLQDLLILKNGIMLGPPEAEAGTQHEHKDPVSITKLEPYLCRHGSWFRLARDASHSESSKAASQSLQPRHIQASLVLQQQRRQIPRLLCAMFICICIMARARSPDNDEAAFKPRQVANHGAIVGRSTSTADMMFSKGMDEVAKVCNLNRNEGISGKA